MEKMKSHKPILIVLEGPAGVGKTTMQKFLHESISLKNVIVDSLPEFSNSKIGKLIEEHSYFKQENPSWLLGINGLMIFLADKIKVLENAQYDKEKLWICDRFITTQYILGLKEISGKKDNLFAKEIIQRVFDWSLEKISEQSIFFFLILILIFFKSVLKTVLIET